MSNLPAVLSTVLASGVSQMASAVKSQKAMEGHIYSNVLTITLIAVVRTGRAWALGDAADVSETKISSAIAEFENAYIAAGHHIFRGSEDLKEFLAVKRNKDKNLAGPLQRAYRAAAKAANMTKKEHAIAEVQNFAKKIFKDMVTNHAGTIRDLSKKENAAELVKVWQEFVELNYASTYNSLKAFFGNAPKANTGGADKVKAALETLVALTDHAEITAMIQRLQARADELAAAVTIATEAVNAGRDAETPDTASEDVAPEAERIAA